ncbi:hypothetical protein SAY87_027461 [Trapa incisa]|uniref:Uncharacterized protein n=1 Tax=Trapa incisa TaxID=236973 RepID=A0AAN7H4N6_9MYRT|nr:hypothetical protein SAY87_027461 [Trapa incisa]
MPASPEGQRRVYASISLPTAAAYSGGRGVRGTFSWCRVPTAWAAWWISIGGMSAAVAGRLHSTGFSLTVYARTPSKATSLTSLGAHLIDSTRATSTSPWCATRRTSDRSSWTRRAGSSPV